MTEFGPLLDVEVPVVVRFGATSMLLRDVLALQPGSLIRFSRSPEQPVDLVMNGCVVARGTLVNVQGNYGLRITGIVGGDPL